MPKKYTATLSEEQRDRLRKVTRSGKARLARSPTPILSPDAGSLR